MAKIYIYCINGNGNNVIFKPSGELILEFTGCSHGKNQAATDDKCVPGPGTSYYWPAAPDCGAGQPMSTQFPLPASRDQQRAL